MVVPYEKPVVLLTQDLIEVAQRRLRVHVHGHCRQGFGPAYVVPQTKPTKKHLAAALAVGAAMAGCNKPIEVRTEPPDVPPEPPPTVTVPAASAAATATTETTATTIATETPPTTAVPTTTQTPTAPTTTETPRKTRPIEVRESPPDFAG